jgi:hypothetical protein
MFFRAEKILPMTIPLDASGLNFRAGPGLGRAARTFYSVKELKTAFRARLGPKQNFAGFKISAHARPIKFVGGPGSGRAGLKMLRYKQALHPGWSGQNSTFDRISRPIEDRLAPRRSGQGYQTRSVRPLSITSQTGAGKKTMPPPMKQIYKPKQKEEVQKMEFDPKRITGQDIIQIGSMDVPIGEDGKRPIVPNNKVVTSTPEVVAANDHEAS